MTEEVKKEIDPKEVYRQKIAALLNTPKPKEEKKVESPSVETTYDKMKKIGSIQKGIPELFKIEESVFDVPCFVTEEEDGDLDAEYTRIKPPSNNPDADKYWVEVSPRFNNLGKRTTHSLLDTGSVSYSVNRNGETPDILKISVVAEPNGRPTLLFEIEDKDDLKPEEVINWVSQVGLKPDRTSCKKINGGYVMDVTV